MTQQRNGTVKFVDSSRQFGFIKPDLKGAPDVFFSFDQMRGNAARIPAKGEKVIYEEGIGKRGPIATTLYNLSDPLAVEDHKADLETAQRLAAQAQAAHAARKEFTLSLYERNRQWREQAASRAAAKKAAQ
jgi:cold shock CspA family protein